MSDQINATEKPKSFSAADYFITVLLVVPVVFFICISIATLHNFIECDRLQKRIDENFEELEYLLKKP